MSDNTQRVAKVRVAGGEAPILVPITSLDKPQVSEEQTGKWQHIIDVAAQIIGVPAGLIMRLEEDRIEVFLRSRTEGNPYHPHETESLLSGLYCETVTGKRRNLMVPNALNDPQWKENPDVSLNMISYLGSPIQWPDGEVFGTFCLLDREEHHFSPLHEELLNHLREIIQSDLKLLLLYQRLEERSSRKDLQLREIHHRVKNHFNILISSINLHERLEQSGRSVGEILADIHGRVLAIANIHEQLSRSSDLDHVSLGSYVREIGTRIVESLAPGTVEFRCEAHDLTVSPQTSVPCGLLVSELVTNSVKYAFKTTTTPVITVTINTDSSGKITFSYRDNGSGLPDSVDPDTAGSLGMILIRHLTDQLKGTRVVRNDPGVHYQFTFSSPSAPDDNAGRTP